MYIFRTSGQYYGFIFGDNIFDRDGRYIGWKTGLNVWGPNGHYRGQLKELAPNSGKFYVVNYIFGVSPVQQVPKTIPVTPTLPDPPPNENAIQLQVGYTDALLT